MKLLIDTAHTIGVVALGDQVIYLDSRRHAEELTAVVRELYSSNVSEIVVGCGPGSYTGVRVGMALAKGLALGGGIPLLGVCSLHGHVPTRLCSYIAAFDARAGGAYYSVNGGAPQAGSIEELQAALADVEILVSPDLEILQERLDLEIPSEKSRPNPKKLLLAAGERVEPLYLRKTKPERDLLEKAGGV